MAPRPRPIGGLPPATAAVALVVGLVAAACASDAPAAGVTRIERAVVVAYKPCPGTDTAIARLDLYGSDDPETPVWSAVHRAGEPAALELPVRSRYPGYDVTDRRPDDDGLAPGQRYSFDAVALDGTAWGGPGFEVENLRQGRVRVAGQELDFATWAETPATCPGVPVLGALLTGLVVAVVAVAMLGVVRRVTRGGREPYRPGGTDESWGPPP